MSISLHVPNSIYDLIHADKYRGPQESFREACNRQASALSDGAGHYDAYRHILLGDLFLPGGRIQAAIGSTRITTAYNCLAGPTKILTREYGSIEIEKVANLTVTLLDGNGDWVPCYIHDHGVQTTYALTFKGGFEKLEIRSTLDHGWVSDREGIVITTKAFKHDSGKRGIADLRPHKEIENIEEYGKGVVHGLIYGDGTSGGGEDFTIRVCSKHVDTHSYLNGIPYSNPPSCNGDRVYYLSKSRSWANFKSLPIMPRDNSYLLGFLRGWFLADGCVSNQPEASICGNDSEQKWLETWGPLVGWHVTGSSLLQKETNFGLRKKESRNIRLKKSSLDLSDFLSSEHRLRWGKGHVLKQGRSWRIHGRINTPIQERVYCPVVPTTHSFALACGVHSKNCFVSGKIYDSFVEGIKGHAIEGYGSIMHRATQAAATMRLGGGIGYDFSTLRPFGDLIKKLQSYTSGPLAFMNIYDAVCECVSSAGHRRGAQMGVLRIDHPDIERFIHAKQNATAFQNFNISVGVTDHFMHCLKHRIPFPLTFEGKVYRTVDPTSLWDMLMRSTYDWADPGVLFIDRINAWNNLHWCEVIAATNPCGEQPLPPYGACLLGSFNLVRFLRHTGSRFEFDYDLLKGAIPHVVRAMDNVIDRTIYPLPEQELEAKSKRRMGLGVTGLANTLEALGYPYGSSEFLGAQRNIHRFMRDEVYQASIDLAKEKGSFKLLDKGKYLEGKFIQTLPNHIKDGIEKHGIRNSHLLSIAPTGTISLSAGNVSSGVEPVYKYEYSRKILMEDGSKNTYDLSDFGYRELGIKGKRIADIGVKEHVDVLITAQEFVDSAVSKTCNVPTDYDWDSFKKVYEIAYEGGAKGCTTYREGGKRESIFGEATSCTIDEAGRKSCE